MARKFKAHQLAGYGILVLGFFACLLSWSFLDLDRWMLERTLPSARLIYQKLENLASRASENPEILAPGVSLDSSTRRLGEFNFLLSESYQKYYVNKQKSQACLIFSTLLLLVGLFYLRLGWGLMAGRGIPRIAFGASVSLTVLTILGLLCWSYYFTANLTFPVLHLASQSAQSFRPVSSLPAVMSESKTVFDLFIHTMAVPNLLMASLLLCLFVLFPWTAIRSLPAFKS